jgi:hypothetical protein
MLDSHAGWQGRLYGRTWAGLLEAYQGAMTETVRDAVAEAAYRRVRWEHVKKDLEGAERQRALGRGRRPSESKIARYRRAEGREHAKYRVARVAAREAMRAELERRLPRSGQELAAAWRCGRAGV